MTKLKAIIVEDELASRETLENYLNKYCPDVEVVALADSVKTGLVCIKQHKPDVIFLDIEMPYGNAFDLLDQVEEIDFATVFVTAFSDYAIKALNLSAAYYILKPIDIDELINAVDKIKTEKENDEHVIHSKILYENIHTLNKQLHKIVLPLINGFEVVKVEDIIKCQANDNYTDFHFVNGKKQMICRTLKFYENLLNDFDFIRIHKSHLVNKHHIKKYIKGKGGQVIMSDNSTLDVSVNKKKNLLARFQS